MGAVHNRIKAKAVKLRTVVVDARVAASAPTNLDTARRLSVFLQDLDRTRNVRHLDIATQHHTMARLAAEADKLNLKGRWNLVCNRTQCLRTPATWYNRGSYAFYCADCANMLNRANADDEFCKDRPLCRNVQSAEEAANLHLMG
jgi:hypothetical protein